MVFGFKPDGSVIFILDGGEIDPTILGKIETPMRAAWVEPRLNSAGEIEWTVDFSPLLAALKSLSDAPLLGPFPNREVALMAEREWLEAWLDHTLVA